jgi:hypothetical protein
MLPSSKMKQLQRLFHCSIPCLVFLTTLLSNALASDVFFEDTIEDGAYLRREHCLTKPYHGMTIYTGFIPSSAILHA